MYFFTYLALIFLLKIRVCIVVECLLERRTTRPFTSWSPRENHSGRAAIERNIRDAIFRLSHHNRRVNYDNASTHRAFLPIRIRAARGESRDTMAVARANRAYLNATSHVASRTRPTNSNQSRRFPNKSSKIFSNLSSRRKKSQHNLDLIEINVRKIFELK